jgi:hypothetical protein
MNYEIATQIIKYAKLLMPYAAANIGIRSKFQGEFILSNLLEQSNTRCSFLPDAMDLLFNKNFSMHNSTKLNYVFDLPEYQFVAIESGTHTYVIYMSDDAVYKFEASLFEFGPLFRIYEIDVFLYQLNAEIERESHMTRILRCDNILDNFKIRFIDSKNAGQLLRRDYRANEIIKNYTPYSDEPDSIFCEAFNDSLFHPNTIIPKPKLKAWGWCADYIKLVALLK